MMEPASAGISIVIIPTSPSSFQELPEQTDEMPICNPLSQNSTSTHDGLRCQTASLYLSTNHFVLKIFLHIFECRMMPVYMETVGIVIKVGL